MDKQEEKFRQLMQMGKVEMPFDDFESHLMARIKDLDTVKAQAKKNKKYAILFFLLGTVFGIILNNYLMGKVQVADITSAYKNYLIIGCQLLFAILICFFCQQFWRFLAIYQNND
ncbi:hypothetical protein [Sphingobacterium thalpophilum]|uniref:hypothetical protein n=1 Tax=Sphingobacterium thalpophilum TaxID=259 RepID=UPI0024A72A0B|nr:hypothetical protein [Sphingobacterium thalpophilum]